MGKLTGKVKHFYEHIPAMVIELEDDLSLGDKKGKFKILE